MNSPIKTTIVDVAKLATSSEGHEALFTNDQGNLPLEARRVLVQVLLGPAIDARRQTKLWPILLRYESIVRSRLHELFLELVIDRDQETSRSTSVSVRACDRLARAGLGWPIGEHGFERATEPILIEALVAWVHMIAVFAHEVAAPVRPAAVGVAKRVLLGQPPGAEDAA